MFNKRNVNTLDDWSTNAVFVISSVFGISPFFIANGKFRVGYFIFCYCIAAILATLLLGYASKVAVAQRLKNSSADAFMLMIVTVHSLTHILNVYFSCFTLSRLNVLPKKMREIDALLAEMSASKCYPWSGLDKWVELYLIPLYWINYGFTTGFSNIDDIFFCLSATYFALISAQFLIFGKHMLSRFKTVVDRLLVIISSKKKKKELNFETLVFNRLCGAQEDLNSIYSIRFALLTLTILFYTISRLHVTYNQMDFGRISFVYRFNSLLFFWIIFLRIVDCTSMVSRKSKQFNEILYQLMINDKKLLSNQKLQLHISMKREVVFTAGGFFNMDYTLVHSVIAAATTYVAILVQFQNSS
ncbi:Gustatory receptor 41a [Halyomorpha halys]|nr:Gustatory receptor 41a [Halyomorpha halys]